MTDIKIGSKVITPSTDAEGENGFVMGILTDINSRFATITQSDGTIIKVGKTKIELVEERRTEDRRARREVDVDAVIDPKPYNYVPCIAASGRKSMDKDDPVAQLLRGKTLNEVYAIAAATLITDKSIKNPHQSLVDQYKHLNPGQQRMILGNRLRSHAKKLDSSATTTTKPSK